MLVLPSMSPIRKSRNGVCPSRMSRSDQKMKITPRLPGPPVTFCESLSSGKEVNSSGLCALKQALCLAKAANRCLRCVERPEMMTSEGIFPALRAVPLNDRRWEGEREGEREKTTRPTAVCGKIKIAVCSDCIR